ncbi:TlpA family protein disulfide reductase [Kutzneria sp. CA-103260]|uniref:TlpA family protein disulfide reductase n=1 Tax=Kutzneria sp. CA-103260 TaxID=2802641 RepID=UPI001BA524AC|nr:thioredoxin family protein [Kutzneria sp. CA-103260]QUQ70311.1 thioredoxin [Kutzneria sp. CA-103260]
MTGLWVLLAVLAAATVLGFLLRGRDGRVQHRKPVADLPAQVRDLIDPASPVTLVQLSTTFCAPCRHTRVLLSDLASKTDGLEHRELDLTDLPEVATSLKVLRTPTTVAFTPDGAELLRVGGVPKRDVLAEALRPHLA